MSEQRRTGFATEAEEEVNKIQQSIHDEEVRKWHGAETDLSIKAAHSPGSLQVFKLDDTNLVGTPHCSLRLPKPVATLYKVPFVPCLLHDVNANKKVYLYSLKGQHKKGGNRFCTTMYHALKAAKTSPSSRAAQARDAVIIGDNYNENRNHTNLAFATEVIMAGWYDSITFLYGLLGHTHFGIDRDHRIHNQINGKLYSNTLVDWIRKFTTSWPQTGSRPQAAFIDYQYDWDTYYKAEKLKVKHMNERITDFGGPFLISSFKVEKETSGHVTVKYRTTCDHNAPFRGADGEEDSPGFVILRQRPQGIPPQISPSPLADHAKILRDLQKPKLQKVMGLQYNDNTEFLNRELDWLKRCATEGKIPVADFPDGQETVLPGSMGTRANIRIHPERDPVIIDYLMPPPEGTTKEEFWRIPDRALRPEDRPCARRPTYNQKAKVCYERAPLSAIPMAILQPLGRPLDHNHVIENTQTTRAAPSKIPGDNSEESEPSLSPSDHDDDSSEDYRSPDEGQHPQATLPSRSSLLNTMVYLIDDNSIFKGIVDHLPKGGGHMIKFKGSTTSIRYDRHELFPSRAAAEVALESMHSGKSSSADESSDGQRDGRRGYQPTKQFTQARTSARARAKRRKTYQKKKSAYFAN